MQCFLYAGHLYEKHIKRTNYNQYSSKLQKIPGPFFICFYNGMRETPERQILWLSDAFYNGGSLEVKVLMLNINYGKNEVLMERCLVC